MRLLLARNFMRLLRVAGIVWVEDWRYWSHCQECGGKKRMELPRCEQCDAELGLGG